MVNPGEAFSRVLIDKELEYSGWDLLNQSQVRFELSGESGRADYVLMGKYGPLCVLEAKNPDKEVIFGHKRLLGCTEQAPKNSHPGTA